MAMATNVEMVDDVIHEYVRYSRLFDKSRIKPTTFYSWVNKAQSRSEIYQLNSFMFKGPDCMSNILKEGYRVWVRYEEDEWDRLIAMGDHEQVTAIQETWKNIKRKWRTRPQFSRKGTC